MAAVRAAKAEGGAVQVALVAVPAVAAEEAAAVAAVRAVAVAAAVEQAVAAAEEEVVEVEGFNMPVCLVTQANPVPMEEAAPGEMTGTTL